MYKKQEKKIVMAQFENKNVKANNFKIQFQLFENIAAFSSIKAYPCSFIRSFSGTKIKAVDSFGEIHSIKMENSKLKKKGYYSTTSLLSLRNKWLKALKINVHIPSNMHCKKYDTLKTVSSILVISKNKKDNGIPTTAKILSPTKYGFNILTSSGFIGLMKKSYIDDVIKDISYKLLTHIYTRKDVQRLALKRASYLDILKMDNLSTFYSKFFIFVRLDEIRFIAPTVKVSHKYFIPKMAGAFKVYFKPVLMYRSLLSKNF